MSDDLAEDVMQLIKTENNLDVLVTRIIDRCLFAAYTMGIAAAEKIMELESELEAAKMLLAGEDLKATGALVEQIERLVAENETLKQALNDAVEEGKVVAFHRREGGV